MSASRQSALGIAGFSVIVFAAIAAYIHLSPEDDVRLLAWEEPSVVARGKMLYAEHCAGCHGSEGEGQSRTLAAAQSAVLAPPHDASGHTWQHPDFALIQLTKTGASTLACRSLDENGMPKFEQSLSDQQIVDILSYIKSTWPAEMRAQQDEINRVYRSHNAAMRDLLDLPES